jgi:protease-4
MKWLVRLLACIGLLFILLIGGGVYLLGSLSPAKKLLGETQECVLTFNLRGDLPEGQPDHRLMSFLRPHYFTLQSFIETLDYAARDPRVKGIFVRLDHANLGIAKIQELRAALHRFCATGKFAIAHSDTFGEVLNGTGAYYLASAFREIALQPLGSLNLLGLSTELPFVRKLLDDVGIEPRLDRREEYKSIIEPYTHREITPETRASLQALLNSLLGQIIQGISHARQLSPENVRQLIDEAPYFSAQEAKNRGLIDHIFYLDECERYVQQKAGKEAKLIPFPLYHRLVSANPVKQGPIVALIYGTGTITRTALPEDVPFVSEKVMGSEEIGHAFEAALQDKRVKAIVFRLNSTGGSPIASETIARKITEARNQGIPVVVSMSEYAASGAYWIASGATKIVAQPGTITGSIGVAGGKVVFARLWDKLGISWSMIKAGKNADMHSFNHDFTPEQWQKHQEWLDFIYEKFLQRVSQGRNLSLAHVRQVARGRVWTGEDALKMGLVDALGDMEDAIKLAKSEAGLSADQPVTLKTYPSKPSLWQHVWRILDDDEEGGLDTMESRGHILARYLKALMHALFVGVSPEVLTLPSHTPIR